MTEINTSDDAKRELLYLAIEDNQNTIRFTDTKAGAIFVLCGVAFAFIGTLFKDVIKFHKKFINAFPNNNFDIFLHSLLILLFVIGLIFLYLSIIYSIKAISPKSGPIGSVDADTTNIPNVFYLSKLSPSPSSSNLLNDREGSFKLEHKFSVIKNDIANLKNETLFDILIFELQKVSVIRELKIQRVRQSIRSLLIGINFLLAKALIMFILTIYT